MTSESEVNDRPSPSRGDVTAWSVVPVVGSTALPPDPKLMNAIGLNHAFETAVADLVDNSIDAQSSVVLIRFVREGDRLLGLYVVDDGEGMSDEEIDKAMTLGGQREYDEKDLGHFGIGLKAASLGQARSLTVVSRRDGKAVARRWTIRGAASGFECEIVDDAFAAATMDTDWGALRTPNGTVVRWDDVRAFPGSNNPQIIERYLEKTFVELRQHLGLVFHRIIEMGRVAIVIDQFDIRSDEVGPPFHVEPLDPFAYVKTGRPGYPKDLIVEYDTCSVALACHIWPGRSQLVNFRLPGGAPERHEGLYFYRHDRLLQAGGWSGTANVEREYQLARVAVDIDDGMSGLFSMNAEKTRVEVAPSFYAALEATCFLDGSAWADYLSDAADAFRASRKRTRSRSKVVAPGKGFAPLVRKAIERELEFLPGEEPIAIRWVDFDGAAFFDVDRDEHAIWLNKKYRWAVVGDRATSLNDAPLVKALLYLLIEDLFHGSYLGAKDRDNIELWSEILAAAARAELS